MTRSKANQAHTLISHYESLYREKYTKKPVLNRYRDKWGFEAMIDDLGEQNARRVIDYYFTTARFGHPLIYLFRNYDNLYNDMLKWIEWEEQRKRWREDTKRMMEERNGDDRG